MLEPPSVQLEERKVAKEGENISVYCNASGVPPPTVSWRKLRINGDITNGHSLNINNISRCQGGEYRCTASNICGTASTTVDIEVQCKRKFLSSKPYGTITSNEKTIKLKKARKIKVNNLF